MLGYKDAVFSILADDLRGTLDAEAPRIEVVELSDVTGVDEVLGLRLSCVAESRAFEVRIGFPEWEPFDDQRPHEMALGLASLVRIHVREEFSQRET